MAVGTDDAARVVAAFRHSAAWDADKRLRVLKALLARTDDERELIDELAQFLFVGAERRIDSPTWSKRAGRPPATGPVETRVGQRGVVEAGEPRTAWWKAVAGGALLVAAVGGLLFWLLPSGPGGGTGTGDAGVVADASRERDAGPRDAGNVPPPSPSPSKAACEQEPPAQWPAWPFGLAAVLGLAPFGVVLWRWLRARRRRRRVLQIGASTGERAYRFDVPASALLDPLDPASLREAAFHLAAPSFEAQAPWLDAARTVEETAERAGRLALRYGTWREHRRILVVEDVSPAMARWPDHARQVLAALQRQGADVSHWYADGTLAEVYPTARLEEPAELHQVIAGLDDPAVVVVVVSDASALDSRDARTRARAEWLGSLTRATWLHPRPQEFWGDGARWLSELLRVVPLGTDELVRLTTPRREYGPLPPRWRPPRPGSRDSEVRMRTWRAALGDGALDWLGAGALLADAGVLTVRLWWALLVEGVVTAPWERVERAWELPGLAVSPDGTVMMSRSLREPLLDRMRRRRGELLDAVADWAVARVGRDVRKLERRDRSSPAGAAAQALQVTLLARSPGRVRAAEERARALDRKGLGGWLDDAVEALGGAGVAISVAASEPPRPLAWAGAGGALLAALVCLPLALSGEARAWLQPRPDPEFRLLVGPEVEAPTAYSGGPLWFCDVHRRVEAPREVRVAVAGGTPFALRGEVEQGGSVVWTIDADREPWRTLRGKGPHDVRVGYEEPPAHLLGRVTVGEPVRVSLTAKALPDNQVELAWTVPDEHRAGAPSSWTVLAGGREVETVAEPAWKGSPPGEPPWLVEVRGAGKLGRPFVSGPHRVDVPVGVTLTSAWLPGGVVSLRWVVRPPERAGSVASWAVQRDGIEIAVVEGTETEDRPPGDGPWRYRVVGKQEPGAGEVVGETVVERRGTVRLARPLRDDVAVQIGDRRGLARRDFPFATAPGEYEVGLTGPGCDRTVRVVVRPGRATTLTVPAVCSPSIVRPGKIALDRALKPGVVAAVADRSGIQASGFPVTVPPGRHTVSLSGPGCDEREEVEVAAGETTILPVPEACSSEGPVRPIRLTLTSTWQPDGSARHTWRVEPEGGKTLARRWELRRDGERVDPEVDVAAGALTDTPPGEGPWTYELVAMDAAGSRLAGASSRLPARGRVALSARLKAGVTVRIGPRTGLRRGDFPALLPPGSHPIEFTGEGCGWTGRVVVKPGETVRQDVVADCADPTECPPGQTRCGEHCVVLKGHPFHHGKCFVIAPELADPSATPPAPPPSDGEWDVERREYVRFKYRWAPDRTTILVDPVAHGSWSRGPRVFEAARFVFSPDNVMYHYVPAESACVCQRREGITCHATLLFAAPRENPQWKVINDVWPEAHRTHWTAAVVGVFLPASDPHTQLVPWTCER